MTAVVRLHVGVAHRGLAAGCLRRVERHILDLPRLWHSRRVLRRVLLEVALQLRVRWVDRLLQLLQRHHRVVELHLHALHQVGLAHRRIRNRRAARHQGLQPLQLHIVFHLCLEVRARRSERRLHKVDVVVVADVLPIGEQVLCKRPRPKLALQVLVAHLQVQPVRSLFQHRTLYQHLPRPLHHVRQQKVRIVLLLQLPLRQLRHVVRLDVRARPEQPSPRPRLPHRRIHRRIRPHRVVRHQPRNQVDHHGDARGANDHAKHNLYCLVVLLKKTNHARPATLTSRPASNRNLATTICTLELQAQISAASSRALRFCPLILRVQAHDTPARQAVSRASDQYKSPAPAFVLPLLVLVRPHPPTPSSRPEAAYFAPQWRAPRISPLPSPLPVLVRHSQRPGAPSIAHFAMGGIRPPQKTQQIPLSSPSNPQFPPNQHQTNHLKLSNTLHTSFPPSRIIK